MRGLDVGVSLSGDAAMPSAELSREKHEAAAACLLCSWAVQAVAAKLHKLGHVARPIPSMAMPPAGMLGLLGEPLAGTDVVLFACGRHCLHST